MGTVTDEEWLAAHRALADTVAGLVPPAQLAYVWDPGTAGSALVGQDETDPAPPAAGGGFGG